MLNRAEVQRTGEWLASLQLPSGALPWEPGRHADPWDHTEAAMGLDVAGFHREAQRAYEWLADVQESDGSFFAGYTEGEVSDRVSKTGECSYLAVGLWHHTEITGDLAFRSELWPTVAKAIDWVLTLSDSSGVLAWARDADGGTNLDGPLVTGSSSTLLSLRYGVLLGEALGDPRPDWELAADRLMHVITAHPASFQDKARYSMDWYYPVLCGALRGPAAEARIERGWSYFMREGRGARCVSDRPWFTPAETCELVLALDVIGDRARALAVLEEAELLREDDGGVWTGWVDDNSPDGALWPDERTSWTAGVMLMACDALQRGALSGSPAAAGLFRSVAVPDAVACDAACPAPLPGSVPWSDALQYTQASDLGDLLESP